MERLVQGTIKFNSSLDKEHLGLDCLGNLRYVNRNINYAESLELEEEAGLNYSSTTASLDEYNMPFLQMLQSPPLFASTEHNFQYLKKEEKPCNNVTVIELAEMGETKIQGLELESCVTQDVMNQKVSKYCAPKNKRKRKRKRQRQAKNKEEAESQRMTHIAVERNRRRQMNDHLSALRSLMPTSYIQRGHQASIIGGAIDFVTDLERVLNSLEARKRTRLVPDSVAGTGITSNTLWAKCGDGWSEVTVEEEQVKVKVQCRRRSGQLVRAIVALEEELRLTVLHLDISSPSMEVDDDTVLYSFNLKIENDCELGSVEQIEAAVQQIFSISNGS